MAMPMVGGTPISPLCQFALKMERDAWRFVVVVAVLAIAVMWYFAGLFPAVLTFVVVGILGYLVYSHLKISEHKWLEINKKDHEVSAEIEGILRTFDKYSVDDIYSAGVTEDQFGPLWYARYAQYFSGERSLSGDVLGMTLSNGILSASGSLSGKVVGSVGPDSISDMGAVVIMQNDRGDILRVVIPQKQIAEKMFTEALLLFCKDEDTFKTHTSLHIMRLAHQLSRKASCTTTSALLVLDQVVASFGNQAGEQSRIKVYGQEVSRGVILATALEINGERGVFIPTSYLKEVTDKLSELLGTYRGDAKMLLRGEGPFAPKKV